MFTGIIDHLGTIESLQGEGTLTIGVTTRFPDLKEGESIAVNGTCLTVVRPQSPFQEKRAVFELSAETLAVTCARDWKVGDGLNLERALLASDRLGGHWVTGHVDCSLTVLSKLPQAGYVELQIGEVPQRFQRFLLPKGSITVNGVSLTINSVEKDSFKLMLIPHTLEITNLRDLVPGQRVNAEFDWMLKAILTETERLFKELQINGQGSIKE